MITIISGTNRPNSYTNLTALALKEVLVSKGIEDVSFLNLEDLNQISIGQDFYLKMPDVVEEMQKNALIPIEKWIIVSPEYNGGMPGILKLWIDMLSLKHRNETFKGKKIALVGVSSGRAGNSRGMDHLTNMLNYLGSHIMPLKLPLSSIMSLIDSDSKKLNSATFKLLESYVDEVISF